MAAHFAESFFETFVSNYDKYVSTIEKCNLQNNHLPKDISPQTFLENHHQFKDRIFNGDKKVFFDIPYFNRRRVANIDPTSLENLLLHLSNLYVYANFATTDYAKLSKEEKVLASNILETSAQGSSTETKKSNFRELIEECQEDIVELMTPEIKEKIKTSLSISHPIPDDDPENFTSAIVSKFYSDGQFDPSKVPPDVMELVLKMSEKIMGKIQSGELDEKTIITEAMALMGGGMGNHL